MDKQKTLMIGEKNLYFSGFGKKLFFVSSIFYFLQCKSKIGFTVFSGDEDGEFFIHYFLNF